MTLFDVLPQWRDHLEKLSSADAVIDLLDDPNDIAAQQEVVRLLFQALGNGVAVAFVDPDHPDFYPVVSTAFPHLGTNPDFIYSYSQIDGHGTYRLTGSRGTGLFLLFNFSAGGFSTMDDLGPSFGVLDVDNLSLGKDGSFSVILSEQQPSDYDGDWYQIDTRTRVIGVREASYNWGKDVNARFAIDRLDKPVAPQRMSAAEIARRLENLAVQPLRYARFALNFIKSQRERKLYNAFELDDWSGRGGLNGQFYYQGLFRLDPDSVLILETDIPESVRYWNVQLNDMLWNAIDWQNRQSSLNAAQATIDHDGKFRGVIALDDPGVPNWLDTGGNTQGSIMLRWTEANSNPRPSLRHIPLSELRSRLPENTSWVDTGMRQEILRARRIGVQMRRRW